MPSPVLPWDPLEIGPDVHAGRVEPDEEWFLLFICLVDEVESPSKKFFVDRLHAFLRERTRVLALLVAPFAKPWIWRGRVRTRGHAFQHAARREPRLEGGILRVVLVFRLLFGVQVVHVAEKHVEAVHGRQMLVAVAQMVLAELACHVALGLKQVGNGRVFVA